VPIVSSGLEHRGGIWLSWNGADCAPPRRVQGLPFDILTIGLGRRDAAGFHAGFANRTLWPLFHDQVIPSTFGDGWWHAYRNANEVFARAAQLAAARLVHEPLIWVHDYHLLLVPERLRRLGARQPIGFFLHTPFPPPELFARLPQRVELLAGLGGSDVVGFHTDADRRRFRAAWSQFADGSPPSTLVAPASIDVAAGRAAATDSTVAARTRHLRARLGDRVILLGVERLDYTKGIPERLRALVVLLERRRDLRRRIVYVQIAQPSRERLPEYRSLRDNVEREIGRLNGRFTEGDSAVPFRYLARTVRDRELAAYYLAADVALVTPLRDGMNLVAKEFVVAQHAAGGHGALVLSEFAGAAAELGDAYVCNPYDPDAVADMLEEVIEVDHDERRVRLARMAEQIAAFDVADWAERQLGETERRHAVRSPLGPMRRAG
jgi:trehalose 6-phosphate synthase